MTRAHRTQAERRAETRSALMRSATKLFAQRGLRDTSIDDVAEEAGYSKGAFYANFKNKEELFLAMLDERFADRLKEMEEALESDEPPERQAHRVGVDYAHHIAGDPAWQRLFFEFAAYALRNEDFREELVTRYAALRARMVEIFERRAARLSLAPSISLAEISLMTCAMTDGFALNSLLEPGAIDGDLYPRMLAIFFTGLAAMQEPPGPRH